MFFCDFWRCTSYLHPLGPWVKILISVLGTVLNIFKNIKFDLKKVLRSHFEIFPQGPHRPSTLLLTEKQSIDQKSEKIGNATEN